MRSIFKRDDKKDIIDRIQQLIPQTQPGWGKMNVSQMPQHCQQPIR